MIWDFIKMHLVKANICLLRVRRGLWPYIFQLFDKFGTFLVVQNLRFPPFGNNCVGILNQNWTYLFFGQETFQVNPAYCFPVGSSKESQRPRFSDIRHSDEIRVTAGPSPISARFYLAYLSIGINFKTYFLYKMNFLRTLENLGTSTPLNVWTCGRFPNELDTPSSLWAHHFYSLYVGFSYHFLWCCHSM